MPSSLCATSFDEWVPLHSIWTEGPVIINGATSGILPRLASLPSQIEPFSSKYLLYSFILFFKNYLITNVVQDLRKNTWPKTYQLRNTAIFWVSFYYKSFHGESHTAWGVNLTCNAKKGNFHAFFFKKLQNFFIRSL